MRAGGVSGSRPFDRRARGDPYAAADILIGEVGSATPGDLGDPAGMAGDPAGTPDGTAEDSAGTADGTDAGPRMGPRAPEREGSPLWRPSAGTVRCVPNEQKGPGGESEILVERRLDGVALVTLNRPKANALSVGMLGLLAESIGALAKDRPGALVLWGGERIFAAGADITELSGQGAGARISDSFKKSTAALNDLGCPSIAAISGYALGGGLELALGCDFRVAATSARLGQPEILLGIIPGGGGTQRLARLIGPARAKDLVMTGRQIDCRRRARMGARRPGRGEQRGPGDIARNCGRARRRSARSRRRRKAVIDEGLDTTLERGLGLEREAFVAVLETVDAKSGIESFVEHGPGKATFVGR